MKWDVFICHAVEDKPGLVEPLACALRDSGLEVWYDRFSLSLGDNLRRAIDQGLAHSRYGIVILSDSFFQKHWTQYELDALIHRETGDRKIILPVWHQITRQAILAYSPALADRVAVKSRDGLQRVVEAILQVVAPKLLKAKPDADADHYIPLTELTLKRRVFPEVTEVRLPMPTNVLPLSVGGLVVSPDNRSIASINAREDKVYLGVNGRTIGEDYDLYCNHTLVFSPDSKRVACAMYLADDCWVTVDGKRSEVPYQGVPNYGIVFSPNSKRLAFQAKRDEMWVVVIDGIEGAAYAATGIPFFARNSSKVGYTALREEKLVLVINGREVKEVTTEGPGWFEFTDDGAEIQFVSMPQEVDYSIIGCKREEIVAVTELLGLSPEQFPMSDFAPIVPGSRMRSPNGKGVAFIVEMFGRLSVVVNGERGFLHEEILAAPPCFSPSGEHVAYAAADYGVWRLIVDGQIGNGYYDAILPGSQPHFVGENVVNILSIRDEELLYVETELLRH